MQSKEEVNIESGVYTIYREEDVKTALDLSSYDEEKPFWCNSSVHTCLHYFSLLLLGALTWGLLWCAWGEGWAWNGQWFRLAVVATIAWATGELLQNLTTLPPLLAALLSGILARHLGFLDMRHYIHVDAFLRKIYPVIILGKASLGWDVKYMRNNWLQVATLGVLPWATEVATLAICTRLLLGFPWTWGLMLGALYASVSCAIVMPSVIRHGGPDSGASRNWPQLVCTAGGIDTGLSVIGYGIMFSFIFHDSSLVDRYLKAVLMVMTGILAGFLWGTFGKFIPHACDQYVSELRVLFLMAGGMFGNFLSSLLGWGGTGGLAVLICNATAATHWAQDGWKLNKNPASTAYRVFWSFLEPILFAYTGTFFVLDSTLPDTMLRGLAILVVCLTVRYTVACLTCWNLTFKEKIFICCAWTPKSIVEAVLCPLALGTLLSRTGEDHTTSVNNLRYAEQLLRLTVQAILITTPIGFLLTNHLGPRLLKKTEAINSDIGPQRKQSCNVQPSDDSL